MRYYKLITSEGDTRLTVETGEGVLSDLTSADEDLTEIDDLALPQCGLDCSLNPHCGSCLGVEFGLSRLSWRRSSDAVLEDGFDIRPWHHLAANKC